MNKRSIIRRSRKLAKLLPELDTWTLTILTLYSDDPLLKHEAGHALFAKLNAPVEPHDVESWNVAADLALNSNLS